MTSKKHPSANLTIRDYTDEAIDLIFEGKLSVGEMTNR